MCPWWSKALMWYDFYSRNLGKNYCKLLMIIDISHISSLLYIIWTIIILILLNSVLFVEIDRIIEKEKYIVVSKIDYMFRCYFEVPCSQLLHWSFEPDSRSSGVDALFILWKHSGNSCLIIYCNGWEFFPWYAYAGQTE